MTRFVNPFEEAGDEAEGRNKNSDGQVDDRNVDLAVHPVVDRGERASGDE